MKIVKHTHCYWPWRAFGTIMHVRDFRLNHTWWEVAHKEDLSFVERANSHHMGLKTMVWPWWLIGIFLGSNISCDNKWHDNGPILGKLCTLQWCLKILKFRRKNRIWKRKNAFIKHFTLWCQQGFHPSGRRPPLSSSHLWFTLGLKLRIQWTHGLTSSVKCPWPTRVG